MECYHYVPHTHPERLDTKKMPSAETVFVCGNGDISFCSQEYTESIIERVARYPERTFYFQSKRPECFSPFLTQFPSNVILVTTLETNRNEGYKLISKAPIPSQRCEQFRKLDYPRRVVTIEPVMDFDTEIFFSWILDIKPEYVWLGFNSHPEQVQLREPSKEKVMEFMGRLRAEGIEVRGKESRDITG
jgi:glycerol-3-phosphate cytidylyltransferase-like family protein